MVWGGLKLLVWEGCDPLPFIKRSGVPRPRVRAWHEAAGTQQCALVVAGPRAGATGAYGVRRVLVHRLMSDPT
eukprot:9084159-Pyramimonas_sp.AAC.1